MGILNRFQNWTDLSALKGTLENAGAKLSQAIDLPKPPPTSESDAGRYQPKQQQQSFAGFRDGFDAAPPTNLNAWSGGQTAAQFQRNYFSDGFQASSRPKLSLGNDTASLTFGAASAPQDTSFTPTLADVDLLLGTV